MKTYREIVAETFRDSVDEMSHSDLDAFDYRAVVILAHLLKLKYLEGQLRDRNRAGWEKTVTAQRTMLVKLLKAEPKVKKQQSSQNIQSCYVTAIRGFKKQFSNVRVPELCPFTIDEIMGTHGTQ